MPTLVPKRLRGVWDYVKEKKSEGDSRGGVSLLREGVSASKAKLEEERGNEAFRTQVPTRVATGKIGSLPEPATARLPQTAGRS